MCVLNGEISNKKIENLRKESANNKMSILKSKAPDVDIPEDLTFSEFILTEARKSPDKTALVSI